MFKSKVLLPLGIITMIAVTAWAQDYPKVEVGADYSFVRFNPSKAFTTSRDINGGGGSFTYNFTRVFGFKADFQGYGSETSTFLIPAGSRIGSVTTISPVSFTANGNLFTYLFGPQIKRHGRFEPFGEVLVGGAHSNVYANAFKQVGLTVTGIGAAPSNNAFALVAGGGFDIALSRHFALRLAEVDYLLTRFGNNITGNQNQNSFRYVGGVVFRFGGAPPPVPSASCTGAPGELLPDDPPVKVSTQTTNFNPKHQLEYKWTSTGGQVSPQGDNANVEVASLSPGSYTVHATVTDPKQKTNNTASCSAPFTVKEPRPPQVSCSATPTTIEAGSGTPVALSAQASSPDQRRIEKRDFSASAGAVQAGQTSAGGQVGQFSSTATLDTKGVQPGPIEVKMAVTDVRGLTGTCVATVNVEQPPPPPAPPVVNETAIGECDFNNPHKQARVDNQCKAVLDEAALRLQREPDAKLIVVGYVEAEEVATEPQIGDQRAVNVKYYLTSGEGGQKVDPSRIEVRKASGGGKNATLYFLPAGGTFTQEQQTVAVDETSVKPTSR
jgi:outer membrane protein OmpA-like peptidoglycan-associated protein